MVTGIIASASAVLTAAGALTLRYSSRWSVGCWGSDPVFQPDQAEQEGP